MRVPSEQFSGISIFGRGFLVFNINFKGEFSPIEMTEESSKRVEAIAPRNRTTITKENRTVNLEGGLFTNGRQIVSVKCLNSPPDPYNQLDLCIFCCPTLKLAAKSQISHKPKYKGLRTNGVFKWVESTSSSSSRAISYGLAGLSYFVLW